MSDLYGKNQSWSGQKLLTSDQMLLKVALSTQQAQSQEFLVQNIAIQYNRPVNNIYEVGSNRVFFAPTRSAGTFQIGRIIGQRLITELIGKPGQGLWSDSGKQNDKLMVFSSFDGAISYTITGCIIESYGVATDANGLLVQENVSGRFAGLNTQDNGASSGTEQLISEALKSNPLALAARSNNGKEASPGFASRVANAVDNTLFQAKLTALKTSNQMQDFYKTLATYLSDPTKYSVEGMEQNPGAFGQTVSKALESLTNSLPFDEIKNIYNFYKNLIG